jgi:hypothetical protein
MELELKLRLVDVFKHDSESLLKALAICFPSVASNDDKLNEIATTIKHAIWGNGKEEKKDDECKNKTKKKRISRKAALDSNGEIMEKTGFIAKLSPDKKTVLNIYVTKKDVMTDIGTYYKNIDNALNREDKSINGYYYQYWDEVSNDMKAVYLEQNQLPAKPQNYLSKRSIRVERLHPETCEVDRQFDSLNVVCGLFKFPQYKLKEAIANGRVLDGFKWKHVELTDDVSKN